KFDPVVMNYWADKALLTRYYLYTAQYDKVITAAEEIINSGKFSLVGASNYVNIWKSGSGPESLFVLAFNSSDRLGNESIGYLYQKSDYGYVSVSDDLYNLYKSGDVRLNLYSKDSTETVSSFYRVTGKYTRITGEDNVRIIRYVEVVLNYAEALAQDPATQTQALEQLNKITSARN